MLCLLNNNLAASLYVSVIFSVFSNCLGSSSNAAAIFFLPLGFASLTPISVNSKRFKQASWVTNALVDATPISGPALVKRVYSDSRQRELLATLQIVRVRGSSVFLANFNEAKVSAVSPDCEMVTSNVFFVLTGS